jgi:hypothetical protein
MFVVCVIVISVVILTVIGVIFIAASSGFDQNVKF